MDAIIFGKRGKITPAVCVRPKTFLYRGRIPPPRPGENVSPERGSLSVVVHILFRYPRDPRYKSGILLELWSPRFKSYARKTRKRCVCLLRTAKVFPSPSLPFLVDVRSQKRIIRDAAFRGLISEKQKKKKHSSRSEESESNFRFAISRRKCLKLA